MGGMGGADMGGFNNPFDLFEQFFGASGGRGAGVSACDSFELSAVHALPALRAFWWMWWYASALVSEVVRWTRWRHEWRQCRCQGCSMLV